MPEVTGSIHRTEKIFKFAVTAEFVTNNKKDIASLTDLTMKISNPNALLLSISQLINTTTTLKYYL